MSEDLLVGLAGIVVLGVVAQWVAWCLRLPSILLLLLSGIVAGPVLGIIDPDAMFGALLLLIVSMSVAVILFEGGLSLRVRDLRQVVRAVKAIRITEEFGYEEFVERHAGTALPMLLVDEAGALYAATADTPLASRPGHVLVSLVLRRREDIP